MRRMRVRGNFPRPSFDATCRSPASLVPQTTKGPASRARLLPVVSRPSACFALAFALALAFPLLTFFGGLAFLAAAFAAAFLPAACLVRLAAAAFFASLALAAAFFASALAAAFCAWALTLAATAIALAASLAA